MPEAEGGASGRKQDPRVERRRPDPSDPRRGDARSPGSGATATGRGSAAST